MAPALRMTRSIKEKLPFFCRFESYSTHSCNYYCFFLFHRFLPLALVLARTPRSISDKTSLQSECGM
ncbi:uncharacterized protein EKO05_0008244 [Ascochyta rabiei]|uniref:uncharacterized protein n=1 Tax=Didymella rabiei TaxID=5454 RepID=UPI0022042C78|nr:uncharacterized protein EKO05_0008244 [Ascochyta rabiei]UPX17918.1 hypothetical protein EKO05_0008244 [Ascochyta rabiei]